MGEGLTQQKPIQLSNTYFFDPDDTLRNYHGPRILGVTDYDMDAPLKAIRWLMLESNGLLSIAFRRSYVEKGYSKSKSDIGEVEVNIAGAWITSLYCQIEPAMAFQLGLPVLVLRENGVLEDGILEKGSWYMYA